MLTQDTLELNGKLFKVAIEPDEGHEAPWDDGDGRGIVSEWTRRAKRPGEMILAEDRHSRRYFDFAATVKKAKAEGWDTAPYGQGTRGQRAARAAMAEYEHFRCWCNGQWQYVGIVVTLLEGNADDGFEEGPSESLWGLESDDTQHIAETARELAEQLNG